MKNQLKKVARLFLVFFKIGLFTFGGGWGMLAVIENEIVRKRQWVDQEELMDMLAIAESTPGPLAINSATYVGYKIAGFLGALGATVAVVIPSFVIIYLISLVLNQFMSITIIFNAFKGIQVGVAFLIMSAGITILSKFKKNTFTVIVMAISFAAMLLIDIFSADFSIIYFILIGGALGIFVCTVGTIKNRKKNKAVKTTPSSCPADTSDSDQEIYSSLEITPDDPDGNAAADIDVTTASLQAEAIQASVQSLPEPEALGFAQKHDSDAENITNEKEEGARKK